MGQPVVSEFVAEGRAGFQLQPNSVIDKEKGIISNIRILGPKSSNGFKYPLPFLEANLAKYTGPSFIGHQRNPLTGEPLRDFPPEKKFGRVDKPRIHDSGINADYRFNPEHAFAKPFVWAAENDPKSFAFSVFHNVRWANGGRLDSDGCKVAESTIQVVSIDVVDEGGTTFGIFEAANKMADAPDPKAIAGSLETGGAVIDFLSGLFANLKDLDATTKDAISAIVMKAMSGDVTAPADGADASGVAPAMESLRRYGPVGKWAAAKLDALFVAEAAKRKSDWADKLIKDEAVPAELITPTFISMVAESFGNDARAKEIIADRKALTGRKVDPKTTDRKDGKQKTVAEIVAESAR